LVQGIMIKRQIKRRILCNSDTYLPDAHHPAHHL
jgi:hypothetical protein